MESQCSSSLLALDQALRAIRNGQCDAAVVGGSNLCVNPVTTALFTKLGALSADGACKCFDASGPWLIFLVLFSFYRAMLRRARYCYGKLSVRLSVCLSVTLRYCDYIGRKSSKIISWLVSLGCSLFATPTSRGYSKGNTPKFLPE